MFNSNPTEHQMKLRPKGGSARKNTLRTHARVAAVEFTHDLERIVKTDQFRVGPRMVLVEVPGGGAEEDGPLDIGTPIDPLRHAGSSCPGLGKL
ncbi:hypothetical protein [Paeniglutamicibacter cryotolerans]|uniref:Uncharacterized protein n=1 Tax=Paeniglutamicibacter cryotolerans TaxID=670079 RepID=A0A839QLV7_9MICC|nr:hypothetical protein [Paeniglutamicibacter cryotolerans]MBB2997219.1 hypothetical protein [Paeniglutamicibacter cryotolerans]